VVTGSQVLKLCKVTESVWLYLTKLVVPQVQVAQPSEVSEGVGREELNVIALKIEDSEVAQSCKGAAVQEANVIIT